MEHSEEWKEWFKMTPAERFVESQKLWNDYIKLGGSLDPEPDHQSPFFDAEEWRQLSSDGRPGMRVIRRSRI